MEIKISAFIFILLYTVNCKPADSNDFETGEDLEIQNDTNQNYGGEYDEADPDDPEESRVVEEEKPLKMLTPEQHFIKNLSETVVLPCEISGSNFVRVWRKINVVEPNGAKTDQVLFQASIAMAATSNVRQLEDGSLEISNLHSQDAGEYECTAMDTKKNSPKIVHKVTLRLSPKIELLTAKNNITTLRSGEPLILSCKASGYPEPNISWHKGPSRFDSPGDTFKISNVKHHDAGTYKCLADNKIGEPAFSYINIKVEYKPVINIDRITVSSENNSETELQCLVHAEPRATVVWTKDGVNIKNTQRILLTNDEHKHNLILKDLQDSDFGVYTFLAINAVGESKKTIELVKTPAVVRFIKSETDTKNVMLTWEVESKSNISEHELMYRRKGEKDWTPLKPEIKYTGDGIYKVKYIFDAGLQSGEHETKFRSSNRHGWSKFYDKIFTESANAKQGHHKSHKKGHKHTKEKQMTPTLSSHPEHAEHQDNENQSSFIKDPSATVATGTASCLNLTSMTSLFSIAFLLYLQGGLGSIRT